MISARKTCFARSGFSRCFSRRFFRNPNYEFYACNTAKGVRKATIRQLPYHKGNFRTPHCLKNLFCFRLYYHTARTYSKTELVG